MAIQLAAARGAHVIASTRSGDAKRLRDLGAAEVLDARADGVDAIDAVIDLVAGEATGVFVERLRANGRYLIAGIAGGMPPPHFAAALISGFRRSLSVSTFRARASGSGRRGRVWQAGARPPLAVIEREVTSCVLRTFLANQLKNWSV